MPLDTTPAARLPPPPDVLQRIPLSARVILDVNCGRGELGAAYRLMNPAARYLGINPDAGAADEAARHLTEVVSVDAEAEPMPFNVPEGLDCVIYFHVLERLRDPWDLIRRHAAMLSPDGVMLFCVPNIEHWSFAERLLRGTWDYEPSGLLARHHARWFSLDSMRRNLTELGLTPCDVHARIFDAARSQAFASALAPGLQALGIDPEAFARRAAPLQYIWRARREKRQPIRISATILTPVGGVSHVRIIHPLDAMATEPLVTTSLTDRIEPAAPDDDAARIFVLHRPALIGEHGHQVLDALVNQGWVVVTEFDDNPDFFPGMRTEEQLSFRGVHALQTSTPALAEILRSRNPEIAIFPNSIVSLPPVRNFQDPRSMTLFFGALNREQDWRDVMPVLNSVAARMGEQLKFQIVHDQSFFDALESPHKAFTPTCDYETYMRLLGGCEISLMPLADNGFNRAKSDLKFIEAGACRVAPLASTVVYSDSIEDGRTGLLFSDPAEFNSRLLRLLTMPELAREVGDAARSYVSDNRMLAYQVAPRLAWYRSLWLRREALTAAMRARMGTRPGA
jgi:glycosyltransferase involved in cell wall biosynthesis